jgi:hypothetical protein
MTNWLANATGIHISPKRSYVNRDQLGRALRVAAPIAGAFTGGLGGLALGGLGSAVGRGIEHGGNIGNILGAGALGAGGSALGAYGLGKAGIGSGDTGIGALGRAFGIGGGAAPAGSAGGGAAVMPAVGGIQQAGLSAAAPGAIGLGSGESVASPLGQSFGGGLLGGLRRAVKGKEAEIIAGGIGALSNYGKNKAEAGLYKQQARDLEEERAARLRREQALAPFQQLLAAQLGGYNVAPNRYASR